MGYPPTDFLGFTIKTKDRKVFKHKGMGVIFDTRAQAQAWITHECDRYDRADVLDKGLTAPQRVALEDCVIINVEGNL